MRDQMTRREAERDEAPRIACEWLPCEGSGIATEDNEAQCETCGRWSEGDFEFDLIDALTSEGFGCEIHNAPHATASLACELYSAELLLS